jgi:macrolide transport system ATP-binding/permease protein
VVVAASHDRAFLDVVATAVVDLDPTRAQRATRYGGRYTDYLAAKAAERTRWEQAHAAWQDEVDRLTASTKAGNHRVGHANREPRDNDKYAVHFFGQRQDAGLARRLRDARVRLERLRAEPVRKPPAPLRFRAPVRSVGPGDGVRVAVRDAVVPGRVRCDALDVAHDTRLLVTGPNGVGKSSLLALLAGVLPPVRGRVLRARGVRVGLLAQETRWVDPTLNALSAFASGRTGDVEEHVSALLDVGLLHPRELRTPVGRLSVGQQRRVALARLLVDDPDVLLLDEPTDHLSLALVEELEEALRQRQGPLVVVSHDRWLRRRWEGDVLAMVAAEDGGGH